MNHNAKRRAALVSIEKHAKNGPKDPPDWERWVGHRTLRRELSLGSGTIYELLKEAAIFPHTDAEGTKKYPPDTVDRLKPLLLDDDRPNEAIGADLVKSAANLVKLSEEHNRQLVEVMVKPLQLAQGVLESTIARLQARCTELESSHDKAMQARETLLSEVAARDIATREHASQEERKTQAWGLVMSRAPVLLDQVQAALIGKGLDKNPAAKAQVTAAIELLQMISPEQLKALRETNFLTPEQLARVDRILAPIKTPEPAKPEATTNGKRE